MAVDRPCNCLRCTGQTESSLRDGETPIPCKTGTRLFYVWLNDYLSKDVVENDPYPSMLLTIRSPLDGRYTTATIPQLRLAANRDVATSIINLVAGKTMYGKDHAELDELIRSLNCRKAPPHGTECTRRAQEIAKDILHSAKTVQYDPAYIGGQIYHAHDAFHTISQVYPDGEPLGAVCPVKPTIRNNPWQTLRPQTKSFFDLSAELRNKIYEFSLINTTYALTITSPTLNDSPIRSPSALEPSLLRTCRQIRKEALPIFYLANHFSAVENTDEEWEVLRAWLYSLPGQFRDCLLRQVRNGATLLKFRKKKEGGKEEPAELRRRLMDPARPAPRIEDWRAGGERRLVSRLMDREQRQEERQGDGPTTVGQGGAAPWSAGVSSTNAYLRAD